MIKHVCCAALLILLATHPHNTSAQRYTHDRTYISRHGHVNVYEIPLRDRDDYYPTYEQSAQRKADGYPLNNRELNALKRGSGIPRPGSIEEQLMLRRQQQQTDIETNSKERIIESKADQAIRRSESTVDHRTKSELELLKAKHTLELERVRLEHELEIERKRSRRKTNPATPQPAARSFLRTY